MDIREIEYYWNDAPEQTDTGDVVIGDGTIDYGDSFDEFDPRIFFYFQDEEELRKVISGEIYVADFTITKVGGVNV